MPRDWSPDAYRRAFLFAAQAHRGQAVPGTDLPYILHPALVAAEVIAALGAEPGRDGDLAVSCALLHDTIEDTRVTFEELRAEFGGDVARGVAALSKDKALEKPARMRDSLERIRREPREVWMVKLADRIVNLAPPPAFWTKEKIAGYRDEAQAIHEALREASAFLSARLREKIEGYRAFVQAARPPGP
jgi:(p)ppGpp synthase/HD superfamily hydrolase